MRRVLPALVAVAAITLLIGVVFAGSPRRLAAGVRIAGVNVGGLRAGEARARLERRARALARVPVTFTAGGHQWRLSPSQLGVSVDWRAAVEAARRQGGGVAPVRGLRRIDVRLFGAEITPSTRVDRAALDYVLRRVAASVDVPHREPAVRLHGLQPITVPGSTGRTLDREAAAETIVRSLAAFSRKSVALPVKVDRPRISAADFAPALAQIRTALSAPVRLTLGDTRWRVRRSRFAQLLVLPHDGSTRVHVGGHGADRYFARLGARVDSPARDADFAVSGRHVRVIADAPGLALDVPATARALLAAASRSQNRVAAVVVQEVTAKRTTADAKAMGITGLVAGYETFYGGDPNRIHNVQLVSHLIDHQFIAPGATFSFNAATGERTADKGFREAPVIINGELETGLGGGVCQVSTTVFNAAYEAGLPITARTNHALYISHYPLGRDATVNYPNVDLKFLNDTGHWLLLRTFVGSSSLTVALYGTPQGRRVETETASLRITGPAPVKRVPDPSLAAGHKALEDAGEPSRATSVRRRVYDANGKLLDDNVWYSSYRAEPRIVRVGTKEKKEKPKPATTTTSEPQLPPP